MVQVNRNVFRFMTEEQRTSLNMMFSNWQHISDDDIRMWLEGDTIMVSMGGQMLIGVESDGYTHS